LNEYRSRFGQNTQELDTYKQRIQKLLGENAALGDEVRSAQENLRLSAGTLNKLQGEFKTVCGELDQTKKKLGDTESAWKQMKAEADNKVQIMGEEITRLNTIIEKKNNEIRALGGEVQEAQENIRLSAAQASKLTNELNEYRSRFGQSTQELDTYKQRIQKLLGENAALGDEVRSAQENLRLSAGTLNKLQGEFKTVCGELDETKKKLAETENAWKRLKAESDNKVQILTQECERLNALVEKRNSEIRALGGEVQEAQENLRLSAAQTSKLTSEINEYKNRLGSTSQESENYKQRIQKLLAENSSLGEEVRNSQENLRLSTGQIGRLTAEFKSMAAQNEEFKKRVQEYENQLKRLGADSEHKVQLLTQECERLNALVEKRNSEIRALGGEVQEAQENLRLSAAQTSKLTAEINDFKSRLGQSNQETDTYKQRLQKLLGENSALGEEVRAAQENLRLSAGTMSKLQNELKIVCNDNEELKRKLDEIGGKRVPEYEQRIVILSQEIERLNGVLEKKNVDLGNLNKKLAEIDGMNKTIGTLQEKITRLVSENSSVNEEVRNAQENLRLSANQNAKIVQELNEYKNRIAANDQENNLLKQKMNNLLKENQGLDEEVRNAQENLRLSANQMSKLNAELNEYKNRINANNAESETYKQRIQKLISENRSLNDEVQTAQ
jgi:chromosome segregation ATPase